VVLLLLEVVLLEEVPDAVVEFGEGSGPGRLDGLGEEGVGSDAAGGPAVVLDPGVGDAGPTGAGDRDPRRPAT